MSDLADKIDDLICIFDNAVDMTVDTIIMYSFGAFVFILLFSVFAYHLYAKFKKPTTSKQPPAQEKVQNVNGLDATKEVRKNGISSAPSPAKVPSTPPIQRKRLGSRSGKMSMVLTKQKSITTSLPPFATGPDAASVKWVNDVLHWLYSAELEAPGDLANLWISSLNDSMKDSVTEHGVGVELVRLLPETRKPALNNIFCECASNDDLTITCDCESTAAMQLKALRQKGDKVEVSHYRVNVNKLRGRLNVFCIPEKLQGEVKFDGWPEVKVLLAPVGSLKNNDLDEQSLQEVIAEIITSAIRNTKVNFNLNQFQSCPRFQRRATTPNHILPVHYDSILSSTNPSSFYKLGDKLLVKVVKASGLATEKSKDDHFRPFCVVDVDNPSQTYHTSSVASDSDSPVWNEHFLFNIGAKSKEIMFEVYNKSNVHGQKDEFLGLAIVSVEELMERTFQRQVIALQSRPYQNDNVKGTLTLEFTFVETAVNNKSNGKSNTTDIRLNGQSFTHRTDHLTNGVSKDSVDIRSHQNFAPSVTTPNQNGTRNKSTLIIHSVQKTPDNSYKNAFADKGRDPSRNFIQQEQLHNASQNPQSQQQNSNAANLVSQQQQPTDLTDHHNVEENGGSRARKKRRDFFGTIRRRLNRSKARSKSMEKDGYSSALESSDIDKSSTYNTPSHRSASAVRARDHSASSGHSTIGPLPREGSVRSSLSEVSGVSGASTRTYVNDASTLILETLEDGNKKYYLVPLSIAQKSRWRKKGTKLHIFNDHTFVAKHLPGGTMCQVCARTLPRRLGKQGYECRDCELKCHKQCHVKTDVTCPNSTARQIELSMLPVLTE